MPPARVSRRPTHVPTLDDQPFALHPDARRRYMNRPEEEQESRTLADLNVIYWLKRFPHWKMVATIVEDYSPWRNSRRCTEPSPSSTRA